MSDSSEKFIEEMVKEKVTLEKRLEAYSYLNAFGISLEDAIARETDKLQTMRKLHIVTATIDEWVNNPPARKMVDGDLYAGVTA